MVFYQSNSSSGFPASASVPIIRASTSPFGLTLSQRGNAPRVLLSTRSVIEKLDSGLDGVKGARQLISLITARRQVTKLYLGHNSLSDSGCVELFRFLLSPEGRKYRIKEISLNSNEIGNVGLKAISEYLNGNTELVELFLQNNQFVSESESIGLFVDALNNSHLKVLSLVSNTSLSDEFAAMFLPRLNSPYLTELHMSAIGLTTKSVDAVVKLVENTAIGPMPGQTSNNTIVEVSGSTSQLVGTRSLQTLKLNGNRLGLRGVKRIIDAVGKKGFGILKFECYANSLGGSGEVAPEDVLEAGGEGGGTLGNISEINAGLANILLHSGLTIPVHVHLSTASVSSDTTWKTLERDLRGFLYRNDMLRKKTGEEAVRLLSFARPLLLRSKAYKGKEKERDESLYCPNFIEDDFINGSLNTVGGRKLLEYIQRPADGAFPWLSLPTELKLHILTLLAPSLSSAQLARVFNYAAAPDTLPSLHPVLISSCNHASGHILGHGWGRGCIADPMRVPSDTSPQAETSTLFRTPGNSAGIPVANPSTTPVLPGLRPSSLKVDARLGLGLSSSETCSGGGCANGQCMGRANSLRCVKDQVRTEWLSAVGCEKYEID